MDTQLDLYQQIILEHNRKPRNCRKMEGASHAAEGFNPLCGDHLWIYLKLNSAGAIAEVSFEGNGCAISKASASMMTVELVGKTPDQARQLFDEFHLLITGDLDPTATQHCLGKLKIFAGICKYPSRVKCAGLAWHTMRGALEHQPNVSTE